MLNHYFKDHQGLSDNPLLSGNDIDPEEAAFYHWLAGSKEWIERYGINAIVEMMMQEHFERVDYDVS
jgi:hypothetical protein